MVVLLGTNDHLQDSRSAADLKINLKAILNRIKAAGYTGKILLVSTFMTDNESGATFVPQYRATSWPEAAAESGVAYWDMSTWFGAWDPKLMMDGNHCNASGGKKIAVEMFREILEAFPPTAVDRPQRGTPVCNGRHAWYARGRIMVPAEDIDPGCMEQFAMDGTRIGIPLAGERSTGGFSCATPRLGRGTYLLRVTSGGRHIRWWRIAVVR